MKRFVLATLFFAYAFHAISQNETSKAPVLYGGPGFGLDHGGLGVKLEYLPKKWMGIFGGAGYNFNGLGVNGGLSFFGFPDHPSSPMLMIMYGYNAVIKLNNRFGNEVFSETYYGFSAAAGYTFVIGKNKNRINTGLVFPFRSNAFKADYDDAREAGFGFNSQNPGVLITVGFHFAGYSR